MKRKVSVMLVISVIALTLSGCSAGFEKNSFSLPESLESIPAALDVYGGEDIGFSFLYPYGMNISWSDDDGACISDGEGKIPYVLVSKTEKRGMTPEKYFRSSDRQMLKEFDTVQSSTIHEVPLNGKTLYMTRYQCTENGKNLVIERYLEIYRSCYFQYTAVTETAGEMNTALYYAAKTLSPEEGKYLGEYSDKLVQYTQEDTGISMKLPEMLSPRELTIGYMASCNDAIILAVLCTEDDNGNPIYNRQNFIDCAAADPDFVAGYLGADSTVFGSGSKKTLNGAEYYTYPMTMCTGDEEFSGEIYLANAPENGCIVVCYALKSDGARYDELYELCLKSINTVKY